MLKTPSLSLAECACTPADKLVTAFHSSVERGLNEKEAEAKLKAFGKNILAEEKKLHWFLELLKEFKNPLILILLVASVISFVLGEEADGLIIGSIVLMSTVFNYFQESKASRAAQKLKEKLSARTTVIRDGKPLEIHVRNVCPGDILLTKAGQLIPADARVLNSKDFFVNQSSLTGESFPVEKTATALRNKNLPLNDLANIIFSGSSVTTGSATAIVVKTGGETEFGKIAKNLTGQKEESEFTVGINQFSYLILKTTLVIVLFIFLFNALFRQNFLQSFLFAVAVAVGLTPELLPMILSITMGQGAIRMAREGVIVKKLTAIPSFGSMDVLCTDKTGTITEGRIALVKYVDCLGRTSDDVIFHAYLNSVYQTSINNPMDEAVIRYHHLDLAGYEKIDEIPFDFMRRRMSVVVKKDGKRMLISKGAPEQIFKVASHYVLNGKTHPFASAPLKKAMEQYESLSCEGCRVLAVAQKFVDNKQKVYEPKDENHLILLGFIAFLDPPKQDVKKIIREINEKGIEIKIITGDNEMVTRKVCEELEIKIKGVLRSQDIEKMSDEFLRRAAENTTVFSRFLPDEKNRVIRLLKKSGHVVGYLGDGINDAPSIKTADVGISVSNAVDVARESADIILTHKSLKELLDGIIQGRRIFGNSMKYIMMGVSSNFGNMFSVIGAILFIPFLPMLPVQILLNNFLYDFSQVTIPQDHVDEDFTRLPKRWNMGFVKKFMIVFGLISSFFDYLTFFTLYQLFHANASQFQTGWFLESLATQTLIIYVIRTRKIPFLQSWPCLPLILTTLAVMATGWILPYTALGPYLGMTPLCLTMTLSLGAIVLCYLFTVEIGKRLFYRRWNY